MTDSIECLKCGLVHSACRAHNREGKPCGRDPQPYMTVCHYHGGASPNALRAAAQRKAADVVTQTYDADETAILAAQGLEPIADPLMELGRLAAASVAWMNALGQRVNALNEISHQGKDGSEQLKSEIALFERSQDRAAKLLKILVDSGFEQRRLALDEAIARQFGAVLNAVLARLDLTVAQRTAVPGIVVEELKALEDK